MVRLIDSHFHFDFIQEQSQRTRFLSTLAQHDDEVVAQTVLPSDFVNWQGPKPTYLSVGFHPWWIQDERQVAEQLTDFERGLGMTRFIGEVGLDFSPKRLMTVPKDLQIEVFNALLQLIVQVDRPKASPYVMSVHCVQSTDTLLDLLDAHANNLDRLIVILHGFRGTSDQLMRHIRMGGYLSVQSAQLVTKKGRAYVQQIPANRLLLETDMPRLAGAITGETLANEVHAQLSQTLEQLSRIRKQELASVIAATQTSLYGGELRS